MKTFADFGIPLKAGASGETKTTCPQCSGSRKKKNYPCLNVNIDKGVWNCWHCGWGGALTTGVERVAQITKTYRRPDYVTAAAPMPDEAAEWFAARGIPVAVLRKYHIAKSKAYFPQVEEERACVSFPYFRGSEVINVKYRTRDKLFTMEKGCERMLYGLNDIAEATIWVEGEIDKLSLDVAGYSNCVSVPDGAPAENSKSYETKFDFLGAPELDRATQHIIAVDNDAPGFRLREELVRRLGPENCLIVEWHDGCKDANDMLVQYGVDALIGCIRDARPLPIVGASQVSDFEEECRVLYERGTPRGVSTGWAVLDKFYTVRPGDVTVMTGIPNSGKSELLDAILVNLAGSQGWCFGIYSPENWPIPEHVKKLAEKYTGRPFEPGYHERMTADEWGIAQSWLNRYFMFLEPEEPSLDALLSVAKQLVKRKGIRGLVLDPWNEVEHAHPPGISESEYIGIALGTIRRFSRSHGVHTWVVAHPTKLTKDKSSGEYPVPTPYDISGSANWRNKADNCVTVWRDLNPEARSTHTEVHVQKVRHKVVGAIGMASLTYDRVTGRYNEEVAR